MGSIDFGYNNNIFNLQNLISNNINSASNFNSNKVFNELPFTSKINNTLNNLIKKESLDNFDYQILKNELFNNMLRNEENINQNNINFFNNETNNNFTTSQEKYLNLLKSQNMANNNYNNKIFKSPINNLNMNLNENNHFNFDNLNNSKKGFDGDFKTLEKEFELKGCSLNKNLLTNLENLKNQNNSNDSNYLFLYNILTGGNNHNNYFKN